MKILLLERRVLTVGDLDFSPLDAVGEVTYLDNTMREDEIIEAGRKTCCEVLLCNKAPITEKVLAGIPTLRLICVMATGFNNIDGDAAKRHGVIVCNVPGYSTDSVVQMIFAHILAHASHAERYTEEIGNGAWICSETFSFLSSPITELSGKTLGIVGYGAIGKKTARVAEALGMRPLICTRTPPVDCPYRVTTTEEVLRESDILCLCCPLTPATKSLIRDETVSLMKPTAILINTARGPVVDESAVANALRDGRLGGYGCDVLAAEPMSPDCPLLGAPRFTCTPHIAWATPEARARLLDITVNNIHGYECGKLQNRVL